MDLTKWQALCLTEAVEWGERALRALDAWDVHGAAYNENMRTVGRRGSMLPEEYEPWRATSNAFSDAHYMAVMSLSQLAKAHGLLTEFCQVPDFPEAGAIIKLRHVAEHWEQHDPEHPTRRAWLGTRAGRQLLLEHPEVQPEMTSFGDEGVSNLGNLLDIPLIRTRVQTILAAVEPQALTAIGATHRYPEDAD